MKKKERLEDAINICFENMDIAKKNTHIFNIKLMRDDGGEINIIEVSAHAAYSGLCKDIKKIEEELERLRKEFSDL